MELGIAYWSTILSPLMEDVKKEIQINTEDCNQLSYHEPKDSVVHLGNFDYVVLPTYRELITNFAWMDRQVDVVLFINASDVEEEFDIFRGNSFWNINGPRLRSLDLFIAGEHFYILIRILPRCPNLKCLSVSTNSGGTQRPLQFSLADQIIFWNLQSLSVTGNPHLVVPLLSDVILTAPILKNITFVCGSGWCPNSNLHSHVSLGTIFNFQPDTCLKALDFQCAVDDNFIRKMVTNMGSQLESLSIFNCVNLTEDSLFLIQTRCTNLEQFMLSTWQGGTKYFSSLFFHLSKLKAVCFSSSHVIDDICISPLCELPCLAHLYISNCPNVTDEGLRDLLGHEEMPLMIELHLVNLRIGDDVIQQIIPCLPNLEILNLSHCPLIGTKSLDTLANHSRSLHCLLIHSCSGINNDIVREYKRLLPPSLNRIKTLVHLGAMDLPALSLALTQSLKLPHLQVVSYSNYYGLGISKLEGCPSLKLQNDVNFRDWKLVHCSSMPVMIKHLNLKCHNSPFHRFSNHFFYESNYVRTAPPRLGKLLSNFSCHPSLIIYTP